MWAQKSEWGPLDVGTVVSGVGIMRGESVKMWEQGTMCKCPPSPCCQRVLLSRALPFTPLFSQSDLIQLMIPSLLTLAPSPLELTSRAGCPWLTLGKLAVVWNEPGVPTVAATSWHPGITSPAASWADLLHPCLLPGGGVVTLSWSQPPSPPRPALWLPESPLPWHCLWQAPCTAACPEKSPVLWSLTACVPRSSGLAPTLVLKISFFFFKLGGSCSSLSP